MFHGLDYDSRQFLCPLRRLTPPELLLGMFLNIDGLARDLRRLIEDEGYAALVFPAYLALGFVLYSARASKAIQTQDGKLRLDPLKLKATFLENQSFNGAFAKLNNVLAQLMLRSRRRALNEYGRRQKPERDELLPEWTLENQMPTSNQPPAWMPTYLHTRFVAGIGSLSSAVRRVAVGSLPDGRLELWAIDPAGGLFTTWKVSAAPNAGWAPWSDFLAEVGSLPNGVQQAAVAPLPGGRLELWAIDPAGGLFTTWKVEYRPQRGLGAVDRFSG